MGTPACKKIDKDEFVLLQGILKAFGIQTNRVFPIFVQLLERLSDASVVQRHIGMLLVVMLGVHTQLSDVRSIDRPSLNIFGNVLLVSQDGDDVDGGELKQCGLLRGNGMELVSSVQFSRHMIACLFAFNNQSQSTQQTQLLTTLTSHLISVKVMLKSALILDS
jgi:hypothetical protein